uniref:Uncharacterized protein n=1 Tax=Knipowitschia caucasica TaxID=637954 RepID=A0AAV2LA11_KNICA
MGCGCCCWCVLCDGGVVGGWIVSWGLAWVCVLRVGCMVGGMGTVVVVVWGCGGDEGVCGGYVWCLEWVGCVELLGLVGVCVG